MEREYRSSRESWQEALRLSLSLHSYSERPQTSLHLPFPCLSLCNSTPLSSPVSTIGHTAGLPMETHGADSHQNPDTLTWSLICQSSSCTCCIHAVPVAPEIKRWSADISPLVLSAINTTFHSAVAISQISTRVRFPLGKKNVVWKSISWGGILLR